jgi:hypothetical protein
MSAIPHPERKSRRGFALHADNPFMREVCLDTRDRRLTVARGTSFIDRDTGVEKLTTTFSQIKTIDTEGFVKVFSDHIKGYFNLTQPGFKLFLLLLRSVQKAMEADRVYLTYPAAKKAAQAFNNKLSRATFDRGINDLCEKQIIALCDEPGWVFINPAIVFNGDRVRFIEEYRKQQTAEPDSDARP